MGVRKCPKCGSVWYTALVRCAFCGVEGEEVQGPISPAKLNLGKRGVESGPSPAESSEPPKAEAPTPPPPAPEPPKEVPVDPPKPELPPPKIEAPAPEKAPEPPPPVPPPPPKPERPALRPAARADAPAAPAPKIPSSTVPLVFGVLGLLAGILLPLTTMVRQDKVLVTLSLLAWAILAPFAPFGWMSAQRYVDQCRSLGFVPASEAQTGKVLGMLASFLIVFEFSALAVFVAVQILSGKVVCPLWK